MVDSSPISPACRLRIDAGMVRAECASLWTDAGSLAGGYVLVGAHFDSRPFTRGANDNGNRKADEWLILFVAGMWFQDLWTYDFSRTEMCLIPYATPIGEISFCAYNTGIGWRQIAEGARRNPTVAEWHRVHGRHAVYASPAKKVPLPSAAAAAALSVPPDGRLSTPPGLAVGAPDAPRVFEPGTPRVSESGSQ